jgi:hypothetical protein
MKELHFKYLIENQRFGYFFVGCQKYRIVLNFLIAELTQQTCFEFGVMEPSHLIKSKFIKEKKFNMKFGVSLGLHLNYSRLRVLRAHFSDLVSRLAGI